MHTHPQSTRQPRRSASDLAQTYDSQSSPAHVQNVELLPPSRFLIADQPPQILSEVKNRRDGELGQAVAKDSAPVGQRHRTRDQLRKQHLLHTRPQDMHPSNPACQWKGGAQQIGVRAGL